MSNELRIRRGEGLSEALEDLFAEWSERTGIAVEVWALPARAVSSKVAEGVYATIVEALSNVERHSHADVVSIAITTGKSGLRMTVSDDGVGFAEDIASRAMGRGLAAMRANLAEVGGTLAINSVPAGGTTITGVVPSP